MKYQHLDQLSDKQFRRVTGVKRKTFEKMIEILAEEYAKKHAKGGRRNKLSLVEMLLMTLEYLREYRTYINIGTSYGLSESNAYQTIRWVETVLIQSRVFRLPGKKALYKGEVEYDIILLDGTESPIERPKKNKKNTSPARKKNIP